jgi:hypothetical protein
MEESTIVWQSRWYMVYCTGEYNSVTELVVNRQTIQERMIIQQRYWTSRCTGQYLVYALKRAA